MLRDVASLWQTLKQDELSQGDLKKLKPLAIKALLWMVVSELFFIAQLYPLKLFIDLATGKVLWGLSDWEAILVLAATTLVLLLLATGVKHRMDVLRNDAGWLFYVIINDFGNRKQLSLDIHWHTANSTGDKESVLSKNHKKVDYLIDSLIFDIGL